MPRPYQNRMHGKDTRRALSEATLANARILEIGGGVGPWCGTSHIVDIQPFDEQRLAQTAWGDLPRREWRAGDYTAHDICSEPLPFADGSFDVGFAGGVLEDIRDPLFVVRQMQRVCRRVVIETPSRVCEQTRGFEHQRWCGMWHHRWMVYQRDGALVFQRKTAVANLPGCHYRLWPWQRVDPEDMAFTYVADVPFAVNECAFWGDEQERADLAAFVRDTNLPHRRIETHWRSVVYRCRQWLFGAA